jgi:anti-sigma B factor antagonist
VAPAQSGRPRAAVRVPRARPAVVAHCPARGGARLHGVVIGRTGQAVGFAPRRRCSSPARATIRDGRITRRRVTIQSRVDGTVTILQIRGTLTANVGERGLRDAIRAAIDSGSLAVVVNMGEAAAIDSSGVSDLASGHMMLSSAGRSLKICCLSQKLKDVFVITRLSTVFEVFETEAEALASAKLRH